MKFSWCVHVQRMYKTWLRIHDYTPSPINIGKHPWNLSYTLQLQVDCYVNVFVLASVLILIVIVVVVVMVLLIVSLLIQLPRPNTCLCLCLCLCVTGLPLLGNPYMLLYCCHINSRSIYFWIWKVNLSRQPPSYENLSCLQFRFELAASAAHSSSWHCCCCSEQSRAEQPLSTLCQPPLGGCCICWKSSPVCKNPCCPPLLDQEGCATKSMLQLRSRTQELQEFGCAP